MAFTEARLLIPAISHRTESYFDVLHVYDIDQVAEAVDRYYQATPQAQADFRCRLADSIGFSQNPQDLEMHILLAHQIMAAEVVEKLWPRVDTDMFPSEKHADPKAYAVPFLASFWWDPFVYKLEEEWYKRKTFGDTYKTVLFLSLIHRSEELPHLLPSYLHIVNRNPTMHFEVVHGQIIDLVGRASFQWAFHSLSGTDRELYYQLCDQFEVKESGGETTRKHRVLFRMKARRNAGSAKR